MSLLRVLGVLSPGGCKHSPPPQQQAAPSWLEGDGLSIPTAFLHLLQKAEPPLQHNPLPLGPAGGRLLPAPSLSVGSGGKKKEKRGCARSAEEEDAFPGNESFAPSEEGELRRISTDMKIKSQK